MEEWDRIIEATCSCETGCANGTCRTGVRFEYIAPEPRTRHYPGTPGGFLIHAAFCLECGAAVDERDAEEALVGTLDTEHAYHWYEYEGAA